MSRRLVLVMLSALSLLVAGTALGQPFQGWLNTTTGHGYVSTPHNADLNFGTGFTFEAWVAVQDPGGCGSIAGKGYFDSWWIGVCGTQLRSYIQGGDSQYTSGFLGANDWSHIAVTYDGTTRKHYVDGELVGSRADTGPMTANANAMRIGSDVNWEFTARGQIDEVRIWNVARTQEQIRANINKTLSSGTGLVALYHFDGNANDAVGAHVGTTQGTAGFAAEAPMPLCTGTTETQLCLPGGRFSVEMQWSTGDTRGVGKTVPHQTSESGMFWFFGPNNWEVLVKILNGCPLNNHKWVYAAATTDVHYELIVTDRGFGKSRRYFNYRGAAAPAVTDAEALNTCP